MPIQMRKLSEDEATRAFPTRGEMDLSAYTNALRSLQVGDCAELALTGLSGRAAKRRLGQAAAQLGYRLKWARVAAEGYLYFQVVAAADRTPAGAPTSGGRGRGGAGPTTAASAVDAGDSPAPARRRGRPRKAAGA